MEKEKTQLKCSLTLTSENRDSNRVNINLGFTPALKYYEESVPEVYYVGVLLFRTVALYSSNKDFHDELIGLVDRYQGQAQEPKARQEAVNE